MTIKIVSCNLNGIRSASKKGIWDWVKNQGFDFLCVQEVRANLEDIPDEADLSDCGYFQNITVASKKGYSGVGIYSKEEPIKIDTKLGFLEEESRFILEEFSRFNLISVYFPSGTSGQLRQGVKYEFLDFFETKLKSFLSLEKPCIICGDFNIAHKQIDLKNWKANQDKSGFLPEERAWMDKIIDGLGYVDAFRLINKQEGQYTWWSARFPSSWANNAGWRIDYEIIDPRLSDKVIGVDIYKDQRFSDHAPLIIEYDI